MSPRTSTATKPARARTARPRCSPPFEVLPGRQHPLGATVDTTGVNFALFSEHATGVDLLLFDEHDSAEPVQTITLDPRTNKDFHFWHAYVKGLPAGWHYAYRVSGPWAPEQGHRFNPSKVLIDPYALGNTDNLWDRVAACGPDDNLSTSMRSVVIDPKGFDWEGDLPLNRPMSETVIYEMHVRGFTKHASSDVKQPGTFLGVAEKIPYLQSLGVTAVELLPVMEFDDTEVLGQNPQDGSPLVNYWGYSTLGFFAPDSRYCANPSKGAHLDEFREMVKQLHKAGIEVILDVVFNHTNEGNHQGPVISFKGIDNSLYYHLLPGNKQYYMDYSGCGNTVNCNHPIVSKLIVECLEFWVREMHVDGFRFDEGSILSRGEDGAPMAYPPVVWEIELSETLSDSKIIAEAWDAAGLYQIGYFPGYRWGEWNGRYRDTMRSFLKGDPGIVGTVAARLSGSADIYESTGHLPLNSVNFLTAHDGFTLNDLVSYNDKHNDANGEGNRDGINDNQSWNCGVEGETDDPAVEQLRNQQVKNGAALLLLSQGVPMFVMGDEVRRGQGGNNNAYCQDNEISWMDWRLTGQHADVLRFFSKLIAFRRAHPMLHRSRFFSGALNSHGVPDIAWHGCQLNEPGWSDPNARALSYTLGGFEGDPDLHVILNMDWESLEFELPTIDGHAWHRVADTALPSPQDFSDAGQEVRITGSTYQATERSVVILTSRPI
ncbi:MAG: glycogen debranching protein GlgX [Chloroflexota bacterium]